MTRILVVEDSPTQAEKVRFILEDGGFEVETARDGQEGKEKLEASAFDLIVSDIVMPRLSGYDLCQWVKSNPRTKDVPLVLLTALNDPLDIIQALEAGADNFISKPYQPDDLVSRIRSILENRRFRPEGKLSVNVELLFMGRRFTIGSGKEQILGLLLSAFEDMVRTNRELRGAQAELAAAKEKLESRVRVSEEMYGTLMQEASDAIFVAGAGGVIQEMNLQAASLLGRPATEIVGRSLGDFIASVGGASPERGRERFELEGRLHSEVVFARPDGSEVEAEVSVSLVDVQGRSLEFGIVRDITHRRRAERRAAAQHEVTRILAESASLAEAGPRLLRAICDTLDWDRGVLWEGDCESATLRCLMVWDAESPGEPALPIPSIALLSSPGVGTAGRVWESRGATWIPDVAREGAVSRGGVAGIEGLHAGVGFPIVSDGTIHGVVELYSREVRQPDDGLLERLSSFGSQIGQVVERQRAEDAMRVSEERYRGIFEQARDVVFTVRSDRICSSMSPSVEETTGWSPSETIGRHLSELLHPDDRPATLEVFARSISGERCPTSEVRFLKKSGGYLDMEMSVTPLRRGGQIELLGLARDITERKRAEAQIRGLNTQLEERVRLRTAQLEAANRDLESFSYSVSHDLRTPLRAIDGFSKLLLDSYTERLDAEGVRLLEVVRQNTRRMSQLIDDLLRFSRLGRHELQRSRLDLAAIVEVVWKELMASDKGPPAELRLQPLPEVLGDPMLVRQVMENLLSNALKFSSRRERRVVEVGGTTVGSETTYFVRDNGAGFDMRYAGKLFGVFQRLHSPSEFEGTGVGLALVKQVVEKHGGRIRATGEVNVGATVFFTLPEAGHREDAPAIESGPGR